MYQAKYRSTTFDNRMKHVSTVLFNLFCYGAP